MRGNDVPTFTTKTPRFFSVVLHDTLEHQRLLIPKKFVWQHGETLSNTASVKLPCGSEWEFGLIKSDGLVWFGDNGWEQFAKHYSIGFGHFLVFQYRGNSRFEASIFDRSTAEIDYPLVPSRFPRCSEKRKKDLSSANPVGETKRNVSRLGPSVTCDPSNGVAKPKSSMSKGNLHRPVSGQTKVETKGADSSKRRRTAIINIDSDSSSSTDDDGIGDDDDDDDNDNDDDDDDGDDNDDDDDDDVDDDDDSKWRPPDQSEKREFQGKHSRALDKASSFSSINPFFKKIVTQSNLRSGCQRIPIEFGRAHFDRTSHAATLETGNKSWTVKISFYKINGGSYLFTNGWRSFERDNSLRPDDVCIYEMIEENRIVFKVSIVRNGGLVLV